MKSFLKTALPLLLLPCFHANASIVSTSSVVLPTGLNTYDGSFTISVADSAGCTGATYKVWAVPVANSGPSGYTPPGTTPTGYVDFHAGYPFLFKNVGFGQYEITVTTTTVCTEPQNISTVTLSPPAPMSITNYQDWWWNPNLTGASLNIGQEEDVLAVAWYTFDAIGYATWYYFAGKLVGNTLNGDIYSTKLTINGSPVTGSVGSATLVFTNENTATLTYNLLGKSGSFPLNRYTFALPSIDGAWEYGMKGTTTGCTNPQSDGVSAEGGYAVINLNNNRLSATLNSDSGGSCVFNTSFIQTGSIANGQGTVACTSGISGNVTFANLRVLDGFLAAQYSIQMTAGETCNEIGRIGAIK